MVFQLACRKSAAVFGARPGWCIIHGLRPHLSACYPGAKQADPMGLVKARVNDPGMWLGSCDSVRVSGLLRERRECQHLLQAQVTKQY